MTRTSATIQTTKVLRKRPSQEKANSNMSMPVLEINSRVISFPVVSSRTDPFSIQQQQLLRKLFKLGNCSLQAMILRSSSMMSLLLLAMKAIKDSTTASTSLIHRKFSRIPNKLSRVHKRIQGKFKDH